MHVWKHKQETSHSVISVLTKIRARHHFTENQVQKPSFKMWSCRFESTEQRTLLFSLVLWQIVTPTHIQVAHSSTSDDVKMSVLVKVDPTSEKIHQDSTSKIQISKVHVLYSTRKICLTSDPPLTLIILYNINQESKFEEQCGNWRDVVFIGLQSHHRL